MAEWSNAAVLKTVEGNTSGGSNPSLSAPRSCADAQLYIFFIVPVHFLTFQGLARISE